jgi:hypothetical protein
VIAERIAWSDRFFWEWGTFARPVLISALIGSVIWLSDKIARKKLYRDEPVLGRICKNTPVLAAFHAGYMLWACATFIFFGAFYAFEIFEDGSKSAACLVDHFGQYELAERIYQRVPNKASRASSIAGWQTAFRTETDAITLKRNQAVAAVYGSNSREMADRYFLVGLMHGREGSDNEDDVAYQWFKQSLTVYEMNHAISKRIDALCQMAIMRLEYGRPEGGSLIAQAAELMPRADEPLFCSSQGCLCGMATSIGDKRSAEVFSQGCKIVSKPVRSTLDVRLQLMLIVCLAIFGSGIGQLLSKEMRLCVLGHRIAVELSTATDHMDTLKHLGDLVSVDLYRGNLAAALGRSNHLLWVAENQSRISSGTFPCSGWKMQRLSAILGHEALCGIVAAVIAWSFLG